uniref:Uncharacterized protein n=1 Tax=Panagrolaimus sp. JU765 TaxID=591449 RepID=A0AC34R1H5_9BILA
MDDIFHESDDSDNISSDEEIPSIEDIPDTITYRWPKNIIEITETETLEEGGPKKLQLKLLRASDKVCAFGSMGNTRICCVILTPVNESDQEDFEAGISVKVRGARYISEIALRDCISSIIPSNRLKRV